MGQQWVTFQIWVTFPNQSDVLAPAENTGNNLLESINPLPDNKF